MNMDAVTIVSRHTEKAYAFPYLHASMALMCWHNEVARGILENINGFGLSELDWMSHARRKKVSRKIKKCID